MADQVTILSTRQTTIEHRFIIENAVLSMDKVCILEDYIINEIGHLISCRNFKDQNKYTKEESRKWLEIDLTISSKEPMHVIEEWVKEVEAAIKAYLETI